MILFKFSNEAEGIMMATGWRRKHKMNVMSASSMTWEGGGSGKACHRACDTGWGRAHANWWHGVGVAVTRLRAA